MLYSVELAGDLEKEIKELAGVHTDGDVPRFLRLLALWSCRPDIAQAIYFPYMEDEDEEEEVQS